MGARSIAVILSLCCLWIGVFLGLPLVRKVRPASEGPSVKALSVPMEAGVHEKKQINKAEAEAPEASPAPLSKPTPDAVVGGPAAEVNERLDDLAAYIAGLSDWKYKKVDSSLLEDGAWKKYCAEMKENWARYHKTYSISVRKWRDTELKTTDGNKTLFYPFSGPDILNAYTFFPKAETFVMVGLEPVGSLPELDGRYRVDAAYFASLRKSLHAFFHFGFFRTESMALDLQARELNGTLPLILLFLKQTQNSIVDLQRGRIDDEGRFISATPGVEHTKGAIVNNGIEVSFIGQDSPVMKRLYYFSVDLSNKRLKANKGFQQFVTTLGACNSFVKSASYLMHKSRFSLIRNTILDQSQFVLQDDSGIPLKYFSSGNWKISYYGSYVKPIRLFSNYYQSDLRKAYSDSSKVGTLPFGIGYKYKPGSSNLMLAQKKQFMAHR